MVLVGDVEVHPGPMCALFNEIMPGNEDSPMFVNPSTHGISI